MEPRAADEYDEAHMNDIMNAFHPLHLSSASIIGRIILVLRRPHGDLVVDEQIVIWRKGWSNVIEIIVARRPAAI